MKFHSTWKKEHPKGETFSQPRIVDTLGYVPKAARIQNYMNAGINLLKQKMENYDGAFDSKSEMYMFNPYRDVGKDFSDIHRNKKQLEKMLNSNIQKRVKEAKKEALRVKQNQELKTQNSEPKAEPKKPEN